MRLPSRLSASFVAIVLVALSFGAGAAHAIDRSKSVAPHGWAHERTVRHYVYQPRYHHVYHSATGADPYAYRSQARGYYPYYNSGYWRPRSHVALKRAHFKHPKYYKAWGANRKRYHHYRWHHAHHGRHHIGHW